MPADITVVSNPCELFSALRTIDISVPLRTEGRKTEHTETWTACRLLATLAKAERLPFPLSVERRDRPDCLINTASGQIGVEITEAISPQYAAYCALAEREFPDVFLQPGHFRWGAAQLSVDEMRELLRQSQKITSEPWVGDRPEQEWALFIQSVVDTKLEKLSRPGFALFDENWLAIYDNLPLPHVHLGKAITYLRPLLQDRWSRTPGFNAILIEHGPVIAHVTSNGSDHLVLHDIWE
ncbi:MAG: hypothetical protein A3H97_00460 [Acidobacteria bacterium RIFCSPLOWO2_02_FULL_65_29]|nr:MAG: hypothetical protein A3H97_00460 [Acidobacteria bacterium RIFCSPLOWO2_02_FULL_65_29]